MANTILDPFRSLKIIKRTSISGKQCTPLCDRHQKQCVRIILRGCITMGPTHVLSHSPGSAKRVRGSRTMANSKVLTPAYFWGNILRACFKRAGSTMSGKKQRWWSSTIADAEFVVDVGRCFFSRTWIPNWNGSSLKIKRAWKFVS